MTPPGESRTMRQAVALASDRAIGDVRDHLRTLQTTLSANRALMLNRF